MYGFIIRNSYIIFRSNLNAHMVFIYFFKYIICVIQTYAVYRELIIFGKQNINICVIYSFVSHIQYYF